MKTVWAIGLALCLPARTAAAQLAWASDDRPGCAPDDPDLVRAGTHRTAAGSLADGARPTVLATGDADGDGRADELLVVRPRATPYPYDRRPGVVLRLRRADGWASQVIARGVRDQAPEEEPGRLPETWNYITVEPALVLGERMFPVLVDHRYHDRDPNGWWVAITVVVVVPSAGRGGLAHYDSIGGVRRLSPTRIQVTWGGDGSDSDPNLYRARVLVWDGHRFRGRRTLGR
ncbi:MAG: hypothetical protein Q8S73_41965 [Deltaproteobacteria bacterium]|nr:hypothetical protein [Myxococcales bacterium]MDP3220728.1 hypothetical protein [Deltaproteobacteria bacterium]